MLPPSALLRGLGFDAELLVPEEDDISLAERCRRVNAWCRVHGKENAICVSIHFNAYGNGSLWTSPSGWSIYTSIGNTAADRLAGCIAKAAAVHLSSMKLRGEWSDGDIDYEEGFYLLRHTLTEDELDTLNRIVSLYLDFAELQAKSHTPMYMKDWVQKLDDFLRLSNRELLTHAGKISAEVARKKADSEHEKFQSRAQYSLSPVEIHFIDQFLEQQKALAERRNKESDR